MSNLEIFCITNKPVSFLENTNYSLVAVGQNKFPPNYVKCDEGDNIFFKEQNYSELTFHYWFWKNRLKDMHEDTWVAFCQKRRFWLNSRNVSSEENIHDIILKTTPIEWEDKEAVICKPIQLGTKFSKLIKRGWKNVLLKPKLLFDHKYITIKEQFDMHHGYGVLDKAISFMSDKDKQDFQKYVSTNTTYNPHIMFVAKKKIINEYFKDQFEWLFKCEQYFGLTELKTYDKKRLYAYLAERYLSFWFKKYTKFIEWPWILYVEKS
ncbi:DUF4422 domain-containing protein [Candidatus Pelagibacter sp.]|jgi:hypothetical protein|nr:DUF4422 domain-containing protein [Candidatus Pelagibacter sp.]